VLQVKQLIKTGGDEFAERQVVDQPAITRRAGDQLAVGILNRFSYSDVKFFSDKPFLRL